MAWPPAALSDALTHVRRYPNVRPWVVCTRHVSRLPSAARGVSASVVNTRPWSGNVIGGNSKAGRAVAVTTVLPALAPNWRGYGTTYRPRAGRDYPPRPRILDFRAVAQPAE